ncbi:glutamine--tRNA ligase [Sodalis sp. CWE]|uniref:glutamine--tRNA ligase n=1 Tax=Sodalis sp. CWE TaxID=2803816 RepID=UPI001C7D7D80|nr:glutamine--tRNA ligase [Sodalis sp. CWE]MBX4180938.1 glutamine--tRNA ligase [Sodalis sp. CWE]
MNQNKTIYPMNFIRQIVNNDLNSGKHKLIRTRFSPEPNGYLHIGHVKSICLNFGIAQDYHGQCNLRFDDTNPAKEEMEYINAIQRDIKWLGFNWNGEVRYTSNYFDKFYNYALELIDKGLAYVDQLSADKIRDYRGTLKSPGKNSPYRDQSVVKNRFLFEKMRKGEFSEGSVCLRAKINMASSLMVLRDPVLYRIKFVNHHQTGDKWCIYPMYDFAHCISDALEGITHSLCTLEFQENRRLYDWILDNITINFRPKQYEFSRLNLEYTVMSKRKLNFLVTAKLVEGWDDPRMLTIAGLRRRGYTAASIREFCRRIGVTKQDQNIKMAMLEACVRDDLNNQAVRIMAVIDPVLLVITSLPIGHEQNILIPNHPYKSEMGTRQVIFSREIYIDRSDFREIADVQYKRLSLGNEVRLRNSFVIKAESIKKNSKGEIITIFCHHDPDTLGKDPVDGRKVRGVIHWVSATHGISAEFRLYEQLFKEANPTSVKNFISALNPNSLNIYHGFVEPGVLQTNLNQPIQFEREGYFYVDDNYHAFKSTRPVFNRTVELRHTSTIKSKL